MPFKLKNLLIRWKTSESTIRSLYSLSEKSVSTTIVFATILAFALYSELSYQIIIWAGLVNFISLVRLYYAYIYKTEPYRYTLQSWYQKFIILSLGAGLLISFLGFGFIPSLNPYYQIFILSALLGLTAGATISLSSDWKIATIYITIIVIPLIVITSLQETPLRFILSILLVVFYISQIIMIFKSYTQEEQIKSLTEDNKTLLEENKQFIADMVHQIRTPLTVIMTNTSLLEMKHQLHNSDYIKQINSSINVLSNSYEDLSYIISNNTLTYKPVHIHLSDFIYERIDFFEVIAQVNQKTFTTDIDEEIWILINDTELERIVDNNLSNAIKHSQEKSDIHVSLKKEAQGISLQFTTSGEAIKDREKIFEKSYTGDHHTKRSLGLGLHMVKAICEKNNISYAVSSGENTNTFTYLFKDIEI